MEYKDFYLKCIREQHEEALTKEEIERNISDSVEQILKLKEDDDISEVIPLTNDIYNLTVNTIKRDAITLKNEAILSDEFLSFEESIDLLKERKNIINALDNLCKSFDFKYLALLETESFFDYKEGRYFIYLYNGDSLVVKDLSEITLYAENEETPIFLRFSYMFDMDYNAMHTLAIYQDGICQDCIQNDYDDLMAFYDLKTLSLTGEDYSEEESDFVEYLANIRSPLLTMLGTGQADFFIEEDNILLRIKYLDSTVYIDVNKDGFSASTTKDISFNIGLFIDDVSGYLTEED